LPEGKKPPLPNKWEAGCIPEPARNVFGEETPLSPGGNPTPYRPAHRLVTVHTSAILHLPHAFLIIQIYFPLYNLKHHTNQNIFKFVKLNVSLGAWGGVVVKVLRY
jgi:hypothetical protein